VKRNVLLSVIIPILGLLLAGCFFLTDKDQETGKENTTLNEFNNQPAEKQAALLKEREELEKQRKIQLAEFYLPLPTLGQEPEMKTVKARALYLTANVAGFGFAEDNVSYYADYIRALSGASGLPADTSRLAEINKLEKALAICESTEVNALVIDIKNDDGLITWDSDIEAVAKVGSNWAAPFTDYVELMDYLKKKDIYCIARVVAFKDPYFAWKMSGHAIQMQSGGAYQDDDGFAWVNPFDEYVWKYLVAISREAALRGFDEIQYDYVRFPDDAGHYNPITEFPGRNGRDKDEGIEDFLKYARAELAPYRVHVAADVFGFITRSWDDKPEDIGQTWRKIANQVDYICPMIYPSHYGPGLYGFAVPDQYPYDVSRSALMEAIERNAAQKNPGIIRAWFQGFTAPWVTGHINYDAKAISDQILAGMELGVDEYIIWNANNSYDPMTFFYHNRINNSVRKNGEDILARTPELAVKRYLEAEKNRYYDHVYLLTPMAERQDNYDDFAAAIEESQLVLNNYGILSIADNGDGTWTAAVNVNYSSNKGTAAMNEAMYKIALEKDMYKVSKPELTWAAGQ
jgi:hypothetical protein